MHIRKLNINGFRTPQNLYNELARKYGEGKARDIAEAIFAAADENQNKLYDVKNEDYEIAMIFTGGYDADIVRRSCNWIYDHQELFGDEILEIGCDCGFITTFLGNLFPQKHILAIDRNPAGVEVAKKNAEKFLLTNVDFLCMDADDIEGQQYDTVFSMRTMQENGEDVTEDLYNELSVQAEFFANSKQRYASSLASLVKTDGNLISIERMGLNAMFLMWLKALYRAGMHMSQYEQIECREINETSCFQALVFENGDRTQEDAYADFMNSFLKHVDPNLPQYIGWEAKVLYELTAGEIIIGYETRDTRTSAKCKVVLRHHDTDETCIMLYNNNNGNVFLTYYDISEKEAEIQEVEKSLKDIEKLDYIRITQLSE